MHYKNGLRKYFLFICNRLTFFTYIYLHTKILKMSVILN